MTRPKIIDSPQQITDRKVLAVLVRTLRAALGWSQKDVAEKLGITNTAIAKVETGTIRLLPDKRERLIAIFQQAGVQFEFSQQGITVSIGTEVLARLISEGEVSR
jgi:transcriptional regulator with XRE-family HTH domain